MNRKIILVMFSSLFLTPSIIHAEIYKCKNSEGTIAFQEKPCKRTETKRLIATTKRSSAAINSPRSTIEHFFEMMQKGEKEKAKKLFLIRNPDQKKYINKFINNGIYFFKKNRITNVVLKTFMSNNLSVAAIEQTSLDKPGYEIEKAFLVHNGESWQFLVKQNDYKSKINYLTPLEEYNFSKLDYHYYKYKKKIMKLRKEKKNYNK